MKRYVFLIMALLLMAGLVPAYAAAGGPNSLDNWTARTSGSSDTMYGVAYGNGVFVAGGDRIVTSADGVTWSTVTSPPGFSFLASVSYGGGLFVGVGWSGNLFTSPDGTAWTSRASGTSSVLRDAVYGDNLYVAVGDSGYILTSEDGVTWTSRASNTSRSLNRITYGNGKYVAVGDMGTIVTSTDGIHWTSSTSGTTNQLYGAAYGNGVFVATGHEELILTSADGATWTERRKIAGTDPFFPVAYGYYRAMYSNGKFIVAGQMGKILSSSDGITWTTHTSGYSGSFWGLASGNGTYVVTGQQGEILQTAAATDAEAPSIGGQPSNRTVSVGDASPTLSVTATVSDGGTLGYQWYSSATNGNSGGTPITSATSATYAAPTASAGTTYYYVVVTNTNGSVNGTQTATATSSAAKVTVSALVNAEAPSIGGQPSNRTVSVGDASPTLSVTATVSDGGTLSYQWYSSATNGNSGGTLIPSATSSTYAAPTASAGTTYYYVVVTNTNDSVNGTQTATATSSAAKVIVNVLVNFNSNGGSAVSTQTVSANSTATRPTDPTRTGYSFSGWYNDAGLSTPFDFSTPITVSKIVYAKWTVQPTGEPGGSSSELPDSISASNGMLTLPAGKSGDVSLGEEIKIEIPVGASIQELRITIQKVLNTKGLLESEDIIASSIFELLKNFPDNFSKDITLTFTFNKHALQVNQHPSVFYYDESKKVWVEVGGEVNGNTISVRVNHFTKYAVFVVGDNLVSTGETPQTVHFADLSGHWAEANVRELIQLNAISGYPDQTFKPDNKITRAEFVSILMEAFQLTAPASKTFADTADHWAEDSIGAAAAAGIVTGDGEEAFRPDDPITREEMAVIIVRALKLNALSKSVSFKDNSSVSSWAIDAVASAADKGLFNGYEDNTFRAKANTTRAEAAAVIVRAMVLMK